MKTRSIIHLAHGEPIKTADSLDRLIENLDRLMDNGTLMVNRLTDHGTQKRCFIARPLIVKIEDA